MTKEYAGVGSRKTPTDILEKMTLVASKLQEEGWKLRSGGALGADKAFADGCVNKEIYVPWHGFQDIPMLFVIPDEAYNIAASLHPAWHKLSEVARTLMARNAMQVLGPNLNDPAKFMICWTEDGAITTKERTWKTGGTGQAIDHANRVGVPVFNLARADHLKRFNDFLDPPHF